MGDAGRAGSRPRRDAHRAGRCRRRRPRRRGVDRRRGAHRARGADAARDRVGRRARAQCAGRLGRAGPDGGGARRGHRSGAGQQGVAGGRRRARDRSSRRPRARRSSPWTPSTRRCTSSSPPSGRATIDKLVLTASGGPFRGRTPRRARGRQRRGGPPAPDVGDGRQDHDRLGDAHEQGPRADRGPSPVRHAVRPHRRRRAPAVGGALLRPAVRRRRARAPRLPRHARADLLRPALPRPRRRPGARRWTWPRSAR